MTRVRFAWPVGLVAVSAVALAAAIVVERALGIAPCELCLLERWPWRVALAAGLAALVLPGARGALRAGAVLAMLLSAGLGVLHGGVERGAWPSPFPECRAPAVASGTIADQIASLPAHAAKPCDAATYLVPHLPISMADANLILSVLTLFLLLRRGRETRWTP